MDTAAHFPLTLPEPSSYYSGVDAPGRIRARNALIFLRTSRSSLQQRNFSNRVHHRHVLILVLATPGTVSLDGQSHLLQPGNAMLILPYQFHHYIELENDQLRWLFLTFELQHPAERLHELAHRILSPTSAEIGLWQQIVQLWLKPDSASTAAELLSMVDLLLTRLSTAAPLPTHRTTKDQRQGSWIARIEALIIESIMDRTSLAHVARKAGLSERHLRTRFERETGVSIRRYKANFQLHRTAALMQQDELPLSRVAELAGFNSQAVFNRFIRRETGLTPSAWRASLYTTKRA